MNQNTKIIIVDDSLDFCQTIASKLEDSITHCFNDAQLAVEHIAKEKPDVIVCDLLLTNTDGFEFIGKINSIYKQDINILVCSNISNNKFVSKAMEMGVAYYMLKPVNPALVRSRIEDCLREENSTTIFPNHKSRGTDEKITNVFMTVGIPAHIKGYKFLREAIKMSIDDPNIINSITKKLYPSIALKYETTASKVERAIRHAIEVAWNRGKIENINNLFGVAVYSCNEKPTNGEFIALVADKMLMESV